MSAFVGSRGDQRAQAHKYEAVPSSEQSEGNTEVAESEHTSVKQYLRELWQQKFTRLICATMGATGLFLLFWLAIIRRTSARDTSCDTVNRGFECSPDISHFWGQYSPFFSVTSNISHAVPETCEITFAQILSRHGARDPTASKTAQYAKLIDRIHATASSYSKPYAFIKDYEYTLGADQLTGFGQQQMINSGHKFYQRYKSLAQVHNPVVRSSDQARVVESAQNWTQGFHAAKLQDREQDATYPYSMTLLSEANGFNNTLDHGLCTAFEDGYDSNVASSAQAAWASVFTPDITARLNANLPNAKITASETVQLMDLCPFNTVASIDGTLSPFCALFTTDEWQAYSYYQTLGKYYGYSNGNPLGPTQGVGFTNELISRLTNTPVVDHTSTNRTLDSNPATFPLGGDNVLYADFSHDNDMTGIFSALGLYNATTPLSNSTMESAKVANGYSAAWTVPFAARAYFEKMKCEGENEELVRVIVNDRVIPLEMCGADDMGRCGLSAFVDSLSFAREGGRWDECFA